MGSGPAPTHTRPTPVQAQQTGAATPGGGRRPAQKGPDTLVEWEALGWEWLGHRGQKGIACTPFKPQMEPFCVSG